MTSGTDGNVENIIMTLIECNERVFLCVLNSSLALCK